MKLFARYRYRGRHRDGTPALQLIAIRTPFKLPEYWIDGSTPWADFVVEDHEPIERRVTHEDMQRFKEAFAEGNAVTRCIAIQDLPTQPIRVVLDDGPPFRFGRDVHFAPPIDKSGMRGADGTLLDGLISAVPSLVESCLNPADYEYAEASAEPWIFEGQPPLNARSLTSAGCEHCDFTVWAHGGPDGVIDELRARIAEHMQQTHPSECREWRMS